MKGKTWIIIAKVFAVIFAAYGLVLINTVVKEVDMYHNSPNAYNNGLQGVLVAKTETIFLIITLLIGGILFMLNVRLGWVLLATGELLATVVAVGAASLAFGSDKGGKLGAIAAAALLGTVCLLALLAMFSQAVRDKFKISAVHVVAIVVAAGALLLANKIW